MEYSKELAYKWSLYLDSVDLSYDLETESGIITIPDIHTDTLVKQYTVGIKCRESDFCVIALFDQKAPAVTREQVASLMTRLNFKICYFGRFSIDFSDGEMRFEYAVDFDGSVASMQMLRNSLGITMSTIDKWGDAIIEVSSGKMRAEAAFAKYK